jgi:hypothetical protein
LQAKKYNNIQTLFLKIQNLLLYRIKIRGSYMKNLNIIFKIALITITIQENITPGFAGRAAEQQSAANQAEVRQGITTTFGATETGGAGGCCPTGSTCQAVAAGTSYIPSFNVYILDEKQTILNNPGKNLLPISTNITSFTQSNTILTVNIIPPSNIALATPIFINKNYTVLYTLKTPDGSTIYTDFEEFNSTSIPHFIAIAPNGTPQAGTTPAPATFVSSTPGSNYSFLGKFLPVTGFPTGQAAWQILNGISPISQSFLLSMNSSSTPAQITVYSISGIYDAGAFSTSSSPTSFTPSSGTNTLGTLGIILDGGTTPNITFSGTKLPFTSIDLQNGLILNIVITSQQGSNTSFNIVATLRTTDGAKMRKETLLSNSTTPAAITTLPTGITIQQNSTTILMTNFLNSDSQSANANLINLVLPLNLKFSISQQSNSSKIQVLMV